MREVGGRVGWRILPRKGGRVGGGVGGRVGGRGEVGWEWEEVTGESGPAPSTPGQMGDYYAPNGRLLFLLCSSKRRLLFL